MYMQALKQLPVFLSDRIILSFNISWQHSKQMRVIDCFDSSTAFLHHFVKDELRIQVHLVSVKGTSLLFN